MTGKRSASSSGVTFSGRSRARSSAHARGGRHAGRARGALHVDLLVPLGELTAQVLLVEEAALLEEGALDPADQILDGALLPRAIRPAHLDAEPQVEDDPGEGRIPLGDHAVAPPGERHGLRSIEHRQQRHPTDGGEVIDERAHQRLDPLDRRPATPAPSASTSAARRRSGPAGPSRCRSARRPRRSRAARTRPAAPRSAPAALRALARPHRRDERVERALAARVAGEPRPAQQLHGQDVGLPGELGDEQVAERLDLRGSADPAATPAPAPCRASSPPAQPRRAARCLARRRPAWPPPRRVCPARRST